MYRSVKGTMYDAKTGAPIDAKESDSGPERHLEVWSCKEKGGFVWLFFGDKDTPMKSRPSIPWVKELNNPGVLASFC
jgi:phenylpropionate dioxygenase-like ring-hydroxylating dioxygenase large terminal subunit